MVLEVESVRVNAMKLPEMEELGPQVGLGSGAGEAPGARSEGGCPWGSPLSAFFTARLAGATEEHPLLRERGRRSLDIDDIRPWRCSCMPFELVVPMTYGSRFHTAHGYSLTKPQ